MTRHFSMLRSFALADVLTLANGFCGAGSIFALMHYLAKDDMDSLWVAVGLSPLALFFDAADGRVARWRRKASALGADLDSLADVISFGMAPAALGYAIGLREPLDVAALLYFVGCGISRLARFNTTAADLADESGKVRYFEGAPIPSSVLVVGLIGWLAHRGAIGSALWLGSAELGPLTFHPLSALFLLSGSAMISKTLRVPKI